MLERQLQKLSSPSLPPPNLCYLIHTNGWFLPCAWLREYDHVLQQCSALTTIRWCICLHTKPPFKHCLQVSRLLDDLKELWTNIVEFMNHHLVSIDLKQSYAVSRLEGYLLWVCFRPSCPSHFCVSVSNTFAKCFCGGEGVPVVWLSGGFIQEGEGGKEVSLLKTMVLHYK